MESVIVRREIQTALSCDNLHPLLARIYAARGIASSCELERDLQALLPYNALSGITTAVEVLYSALKNGKHIVIIGDFDADGATSTSVAVSALRSFGAKRVSYLVPNRFEYGYGLTPEIVEFAAQLQPEVIVTVDNGISSIDGVASAKQRGWQVVVTDHHLPAAELPKADAIVNPNCIGDTFPSKSIAGVGVIFYVMLALRSHLREVNWFAERALPDPNMAALLDLVALGTVADVVYLDKNNRILVHQGLTRMRAGKVRPGIQALLEVAERDITKLTATDLGFAIGPRLNAAGRLADMSKGIECLLSEDLSKACILAAELDQLNRERKVIEAEMSEQARASLSQIQLEKNCPIGICLFDPAWHQGVIGILASRIKEQMHRPVIAFAAVNDHELKGSARSVSGLHIRDALDAIASQHPGLITKFGGHAMAAGLSLPRENFPLFAQLFDEEVRKHLSEADLCGRIYSDGELKRHELTLTTAELLREAGPWGQGFPEPIFDGVFTLVQQRLLKEKHLKLTLAAEDNHLIDAIAFNVDLKHWPNERCERVHVAYRLDINEWRHRRNVQLMVEHLQAV